MATYDDGEFKRIVFACGFREALFIFCAYQNVPYKKDIARKIEDESASWKEYIAELKKANLSDKKFADGETDISLAIEYLDEVTDEDKEEDIAHWGTGTKDHPYTEDDYKELNKVYEALTKDRASVSMQTELAIDKVAKWTLEQNYAFHAGDVERAKKIEDLIKIEMENEALRRKDEVPQDLEKLNGIVKACEEKGLLGLSLKDLMIKLKKPYDYPKDIADKVLLAIVNTSAWNEGMPQYNFIPDTIDMDDDLHEFPKDFDEETKETYRKLGLTIPPRIR